MAIVLFCKTVGFFILFGLSYNTCHYLVVSPPFLVASAPAAVSVGHVPISVSTYDHMFLLFA